MLKKKKNNAYFDTKGDKVFGVINGILLAILTLLVVYPIYFILIASISDPTYVNQGLTFLFPRGITMMGYEKILEFPQLLSGYKNSAIYTVVGTCINLLVCIPTAFALSRKELPGRGFLTAFFVVTMYFSGGIVPAYLQIRNLGLLNSMWALVLPGALSTYNMLVCRSFFTANVSEELFEATKLDGGSYTTFFFRVVMPLSKSIIAVMVLFHALVHWNSYMSALYYIQDQDKFPLQLVLKNMAAVIDNTALNQDLDPEVLMKALKTQQLVRYSVIIIASIPVFILYPFVQKYFVKGVMIGSVKG